MKIVFERDKETGELMSLRLQRLIKAISTASAPAPITLTVL